MKDYSNYYLPVKDKILNDAEIVFGYQLEGNEGSDVAIDDIPCRALIYNHLNSLNEFKEERVVSCKKDIKIHRGSLIKFEDEIYIVNSDVDNHIVYFKTKMRKTTNTFNWLNSKGDICSSLVIVEKADMYTDGIFENNKLKVGDTKISVTFPANEYTNQIYIGQRFLLDKTHAYEVSNDGATSPKGVREMILTQTEIHKDIDNLDLLIADYYGKAHEYSIEVINKNIILTKDSTLKLQVNILDKGVKVDNSELIFDVVDKDIVSINNDVVTGLSVGETSITVRFKDLIETINVQVAQAAVPDAYTSEIIGKDSLALNRSATYNVKFYKNGILDSNNSGIFTMTDENGNNTDYASIISNTENSCIVKSTSKWIFDSSNSAKYFYLHCKGSNGNAEVVKKVKITTY